MFLITSAIKYHARNTEIGPKECAAAAAGAGPTPEYGYYLNLQIIVSLPMLFLPVPCNSKGVAVVLTCVCFANGSARYKHHWEGLIVQLSDLFRIHKAEQSVLCSHLSKSADRFW